MSAPNIRSLPLDRVDLKGGPFDGQTVTVRQWSGTLNFKLRGFFGKYDRGGNWIPAAEPLAKS